MAVVSAAVTGPLPRATTTKTGLWFGPWNGVASWAACRLGLLAGSRSVLFCWAMLVSDGKNRLARTVAATQAATMAQRNRTANRPVAAKNLCMAESPGLSGGTSGIARGSVPSGLITGTRIGGGPRPDHW